MTNEEMIRDLKQYIDASTTQQTAQLEKRMDGLETDIRSVKTDVARLDKKIDAVQDAIAETVTQVAESAEVAVREHEERYHGRLKHRAA